MPLVAVILPPTVAATVITRAWDSGQAVAPLDPDAPRAQLRRQLDALRPTHVVDGSGRWTEPDGRPAAEGVMSVVATSGTTGEPRGVELTAEGLRASAAAVGEALDLSAGDRWLSCLPLHHVGGLAVVGRAWAAGTPVTVVDRWDPRLVEAAGDIPATLVSLVPTLVRRALDQPDQASLLGRFRQVLVGGAALASGLVAKAQEAGIGLTSTYGMTETWGGVVHDGHPLAGVEVRVAGGAGGAAGGGGGGEIQLRAPMVMRGYRFRPDETAEAFTGDGWYRTGDAGHWQDGRLVVVDRLRDLVVTGGVSVSPAEVEAVLALHPAVADVCVTGAADPEWGERVVAHVVARDPGNPPGLEELRRFASEQLPAAKLPRQVVLTAAIPRTASGKPLRRLLG